MPLNFAIGKADYNPHVVGHWKSVCRQMRGNVVGTKAVKQYLRDKRDSFAGLPKKVIAEAVNRAFIQDILK